VEDQIKIDLYGTASGFVAKWWMCILIDPRVRDYRHKICRLLLSTLPSSAGPNIILSKQCMFSIVRMRGLDKVFSVEAQFWLNHAQNSDKDRHQTVGTTLRLDIQ
jgi:hypothetical protein